MRSSGIYCSMDELATWFLQNDKAAFNAVRNAKVLALFFGDEYTQQIHRYLLKHIMEYRSEPRFTNIWATPLKTPQTVTNHYIFGDLGTMEQLNCPANILT